MNFHWNHFHSNLFWPNYVNCENCFLFHFGLVGVLSVFFFVYIKFICCRFNGRDHLICHFLTSLLCRNIFLCIVNFQLANYICKTLSFFLLIFCMFFIFFLQDYGTLSCWGQNEVGMQSQPCVFQIVLASECKWENSSSSVDYFCWNSNLSEFIFRIWSLKNIVIARGKLYPDAVLFFFGCCTQIISS